MCIRRGGYDGVAEAHEGLQDWLTDHDLIEVRMIIAAGHLEGRSPGPSPNSSGSA
jgi:hypothetical protein